MAAIARILFVELLGGIGDLVIALPAIHALATSHPQARLTVLTFAPGGELLQADPRVDAVVLAPDGQAQAAVERLVAAQTFDLIVSDTCYEGIDDLLQDCAALTVTDLWRQPPADQTSSDRFLEILLTEGLITPAAAAAARSPQLTLGPTAQRRAQSALAALPRPVIALFTDAGMAIKRWSSDRFLVTAQQLQRRLNATIVIPAGDNLAQASDLVETLGPTAQLWPRGSLVDFVVRLAAVDLMIAADTGPARLAAAVGTPTITLFGPAWAGRYGQLPPHRNFQGYLDCSERLIDNFTEQPCWYSGVCPFEWQTCVDLIQPEAVVETAIALLEPAYAFQA